MKLIGAAGAVLFMVSACHWSVSGGSGTSKHTIETSLSSLDITAVNKYVVSSHIVVIADIFYNRAVVTQVGRVVDVTNILSGQPIGHGGQTKTKLGAFTIHALEYCPPWFSKSGAQPCSPSNPLGEYALWFKDNYLYGIHGRPSRSYSQQQFGLSSAQRSTSEGCVVFPEAALTRLVDLVFSTPNFQKDKAVETIKQYRATKRPENVSIRIIDDYDRQILDHMGDSEIGHELKVDVKLVVVDLDQWDRSVDSSQQPFVSLLKGASHQGTLQLVQDCHLTRRVPHYKYEHTDSTTNLRRRYMRIDKDTNDRRVRMAPPQTLQRLLPMDLSDDRIFVSATVEDIENDVLSAQTPQVGGSSVKIRKPHQLGWLRDLSALKCDGPYYWSPDPTQPPQ